IGSSERQPALWAAFLGLARSLDICGMSFTGSPTHSTLSTASLRWFGAAWRDWPHPISGNFVAPLLLFSVVSHCALLPRRSCWSTECVGPTVIRQRRAFSVAGPTAWNSLPVALRLTPVAHSALLFFSLVLRPHCLPEVGLGALLRRVP